MIDDLPELARKLLRDAKRARFPAYAERHIDGWKVFLTYGAPTDAQAREILKRFPTEDGGSLLDRAAKDAPSNDDPRAALHLSASWRIGGEATDDAKKRLDALLDALLAALGCPEEARVGVSPVRTYDMRGIQPKVTHFMWREPLPSKA